MKASEVIYEALTDLKEGDIENPVRYTHAKMLTWLTAAMRQIVLMRPDANPVVEPMKLTAGQTKQSIPAGATHFIGLIRNLGSDGETPGYPISIVNREDLDGFDIDWHTAEQETVIDNYTFNEKTPTIFFVTPRPADNVYVEIEYSTPPAKATDMNEDIALAEVWAEPMREYIMHRAYSLNDSTAADQAKGRKHLSNFYLLLGEETKARLVYSPNTDNGGEVQK